MNLSIVCQITLTVSILGTGLVAGIFFTFSTFVMQALARLKSFEGIRAMQAINVTVLNQWFFTAFFGTGIALLLLAFLPVMGHDVPNHAAVVIAALLYNIGTIGITIARNVPLNNRLEKLDAESSEAHEFWQIYLRKWVFWNHVRTVAAAAACISLIVATLI